MMSGTLAIIVLFNLSRPERNLGVFFLYKDTRNITRGVPKVLDSYRDVQFF